MTAVRSFGFLHAIVLGLIGAGIVHAAIIILLPRHGGQDLLTKLETLTSADRFIALTPDLMKGAGLQATDPNVRLAACRFSVAEAPVRLLASGLVPFWSISVFDARGVNLYSINDRSADHGELDMLVATPLQLIELRKLSPDDLASAIIFEQDMDDGFAVLRVISPEDSWSGLADGFLDSAVCGPYVIPEETTTIPVPDARPDDALPTN